MKNVTFILMAVVCLIVLQAHKADDGKYAQATFPVKTYDFGYIKEDGGTVKCQFEFYNTGDKPLIVYEVGTSCGCTVPDYPKKPVKPGEKGIVSVVFNPIGRPGGFMKKLTVKTNGREKKTELFIEGSVTPKRK